MNNKFLVFMLSCFTLLAKAQEGPQMADTMRDNGKIYVVIAVIIIIFLSIISFLIYLDRKVSKIERKIKNKEN